MYQRLDLYPETEAAKFSQRGGIIADGDQITLSAPAGIIYYTLDGSDPREMGGAVHGSAIEYAGPITVNGGTTIRVRVLNGEEWSPIDEGKFNVGVTPASADSLRISEVHYNPALPTVAERDLGYNDKDSFEFLELLNISNETIDLSAVQLQQVVIGANVEGVQFDFADGAISQLAPGERLVVVEDLDAFAVRYGNGIPVAGQFSGGLNNSSETLTLGSGNTVFQQFTYSELWYPSTDGLGFSLEIVDAANSDLDSWNVAQSWQPSGIVGGTPGRAGGPIAGDSNHDGRFDSSDFVVVFQAGEYEDGIPGNSTFEEGDWNGDGDFNTTDFVYVFTLGTYVAAAQPLDPRGEFAGTRLDAGRPVLDRQQRVEAIEVHDEQAQRRRWQDAANAVDSIFDEWHERTVAAPEVPHVTDLENCRGFE
jgi:hypothetical protein